MNLHDLLTSRIRQCDEFVPEIVDAAVDSGRRRLVEVLDDSAVEVCDTLTTQLEDLLESYEPGRDWNDDERARAVARHLDGRPPPYYGRWIYYPWARRVVHVLPEEEFATLRTHRNRYKILPSDQKILQCKRIAVAGLSVGQTVSLTLVMEGMVVAFMSLTSMNCPCPT